MSSPWGSVVDKSHLSSQNWRDNPPSIGLISCHSGIHWLYVDAFGEIWLIFQNNQFAKSGGEIKYIDENSA